MNIKEKVSDCINKKIFIKNIGMLYYVLSWEWAGKGVPTDKNIKDKFKALEKQLLSSADDVTRIGTGGLYVEKEYIDDNSYFIKYAFELAEYKYSKIYYDREKNNETGMR